MICRVVNYVHDHVNNIALYRGKSIGRNDSDWLISLALVQIVNEFIGLISGVLTFTFRRCTVYV